MRNIRAYVMLAILMILPIFVKAQPVDSNKIADLSAAIAQAEGFNHRGTLPARNHNPGDIKRYGRYIHFRNDREGWAALRTLVTKMATGELKHYRLSMTINQVSKTYAGDYRWAKIVAKRLGVTPTTTLRAYFTQEPMPPSIDMSMGTLNLPDLTPTIPVLAPETKTMLQAVLNMAYQNDRDDLRRATNCI